jgi:uncharacterized repeat protein (TIGR04052 family)
MNYHKPRAPFTSVAKKITPRLIMRDDVIKLLILCSVKKVKRVLILSALFVTLIHLSACHKQAHTPQHVIIEVFPFYGDTPINCDGIFYHKELKWDINTLSFFVSTPTFEINNTQQTVKFIQNQWQTADVALLWFAHACDQEASENRSLSFEIQPKVSAKQANTFTFVLGLPFAENHKNPLLQASPLNIPEMFWSWRNGYKFMRFDASASDYSDNWSLHLGSIGCQSQSSLRAPVRDCYSPNTVEITVQLSKVNALNKDTVKPNNVDRFSIKFDLAMLLQNVELRQSNSCMFDYNHQNQCNLIVKNLLNNPVFSDVKYNE